MIKFYKLQHIDNFLLFLHYFIKKSYSKTSRKKEYAIVYPYILNETNKLLSDRWRMIQNLFTRKDFKSKRLLYWSVSGFCKYIVVNVMVLSTKKIVMVLFKDFTSKRLTSIQVSVYTYTCLYSGQDQWSHENLSMWEHVWLEGKFHV